MFKLFNKKKKYNTLDDVMEMSIEEISQINPKDLSSDIITNTKNIESIKYFKKNPDKKNALIVTLTKKKHPNSTHQLDLTMPPITVSEDEINQVIQEQQDVLKMARYREEQDPSSITNLQRRFDNLRHGKGGKRRKSLKRTTKKSVRKYKRGKKHTRKI